MIFTFSFIMKQGARKKNKKSVRKKPTIQKVKVRKQNKYNIFQRELSAFLKESGIKPKDKFHVVSKKIYSRIDKGIDTRSIRESMPSLYNKFYKQSLADFLNDNRVKDKFPFYEALAEFKLSAYSKFVLSVEFSEPGSGQTYSFSGDYSEFVYWFTGREYNESDADRQDRLKPVHLMGHLRNNYNDSPVAEFNLVEYSETGLKYLIDVEYSKFGDDGYIPMGDEMSDPSLGVHIKQITGKKKTDSVDIVQEKTRLAKAYAEVVREMTKAGFTKDEIKEALKGIK